MLELDLTLTANEALAECHGRGLVVISHRELAGRAGSSHRHLRVPGHAGTLELNECQGRVWVKVHPVREGAWATEGSEQQSAVAAPGSAVAPGHLLSTVRVTRECKSEFPSRASTAESSVSVIPLRAGRSDPGPQRLDAPER